MQIIKKNTIKLALKGSIFLFSRLPHKQKHKILNALYKWYHLYIKNHPDKKNYKIITILSQEINSFFTMLSYEEKRKISGFLDPEQKRFAEELLAARRLTYFRIRIFKKNNICF